CGRDRCQKDRLGLGVTTQPSPDIGRRSSRRKMAIFARNFAGSDLPPPAAISGDQDRTIVSNPTVRSEPNLQDKCPKSYSTHRNFRIGNVSLECYTHYLKYLPGFWIQYEYHQVKVSRGVGYPALRQAPYVALVVPAYGEIVRYCVEVARGVGYPVCRHTPYVALVVPAYGEICDMTCRSRVA
ncbi:Ribosomal RNA processing Brix domain protein, partial [Prunus dulcis]